MRLVSITGKELRYNNSMNDSSNLTEDIMPIINSITDMWMKCYELSAGWTVGITVVVALYILSLFSSDDEPKRKSVTATVSTPEPRRTAPKPEKLNTYIYSVWPLGPGTTGSTREVTARSRAEADEIIEDMHPGIDMPYKMIRKNGVSYR
jgi:hypothetical protein